MKISTIIPLYNAKCTIIDTIYSVIKQTYQDDLEIIIVNDGSTDGCEKLVEDFIKENISNRSIKLINKANGGVSSARNIGINESSGDYIAFLDSDDTWHPQKLEIISNILENSSIDFIGHEYTLRNNFNIQYEPLNPIKVSFIKLLIKNFAVTPSIVIKRDLCSFFNEHMTHTEDHDLWLRTSLIKNVYYVNLPLVKLNRPQLSTGGLSSNKWAMRKGEIAMYRNIVKNKKSFIIFLPILIVFSLFKHLLSMIKTSQILKFKKKEK